MNLLRPLLFALALAGAGAALAQAEPATIHDAANPAAAQLQGADAGLRGLPRDSRGAVDWVQALRSGAIDPRAELDGKGAPRLLALDVVLKNTKDMPWVRFPHQAHTEWLACANCHDSLFVPKAGANQMSMDAIFRGQFCGACHGRVAFIVHFACQRCHSIAHDGAKPWW
jgi:c(7)-type cytochrome triheme protein